MSPNDLYTIEAMERDGSRFVKSLAYAARRADPQNLDRIKRTWPEWWALYSRGHTVFTPAPRLDREVRV